MLCLSLLLTSATMFLRRLLNLRKILAKHMLKYIRVDEDDDENLKRGFGFGSA